MVSRFVARKDKSNDLAGQREALGAVHPLTDEEEHSARLTVAELSERWGRRNSRTKERQRVARALALDALGLANGEDQPHIREEYQSRVDAVVLAPGQATRFRRQGEDK